MNDDVRNEDEADDDDQNITSSKTWMNQTQRISALTGQ